MQGYRAECSRSLCTLNAVPVYKPVSIVLVDGAWSQWGNWTACSSTCGGGKQFRVRICEYPTGVPKGNNCTGDSTEEKACNPDQCPGKYIVRNTQTESIYCLFIVSLSFGAS